MSTLSNYKKEAKKLFIISVKKDITSWSKSCDYYSPTYNDSYFKIDRWDFYNKLKICNQNVDSEHICLINWLFIPFDFKVFYYYMKLKKHFRTISKDEKVTRNISNMKTSLESMSPIFIKEIRKEKLDQIENKL